jgi:DNA-binding XRE family transcriptional regulator
MDATIKARLEAAGFRETSVQELFGLTPEENELVETRLVLSQLVRRLRLEQRLTQQALAERLDSDQANVSKAERGDPSISVEWMLRAAFSMGADRRQVGQALTEGEAQNGT